MTQPKLRRNNDRPLQHSDGSSCNECRLFSICVLPAMRSESADAAAAFQPLATLDPGDFLFRREADFTHLYAVREGILVRWQSRGPDAGTVVGFYLPGDIAGLGGFANGYYRFSVTAVKPAVVCPVDWSVLEAANLHHSVRALYKAMGRQAALDGEQSRYLKRFDPREKVQTCIASLAHRRPRVASEGIDRLRLDASLIANHLAVSVEEVCRWAPVDPDGQITLRY